MQDENRMDPAEQQLVAGEVMETLGEPDPAEAAEAATNDAPDNTAERQRKDDPLYVQKRLKRQERAHAREMREMQNQIQELSQRLQGQADQGERGADTFGSDSADTIAAGDIDTIVQRAISQAMKQKEMEQRKAQEMQKLAHIEKQFQSLNDHLDQVGDQYDDFDETVRGRDVPFTDAMREASLVLPMSGKGSAGEVLYKLGKNRAELERISKLHPLDQAKEMIKLSMALMGGQSSGNDQMPNSQKSLGLIKSQPAYSSGDITDRTPVSELRKRMRDGWKKR